jgi:MSHA pilin protein MshD
MCISKHQSGISLIELIMFIVIVSIALAGVINVLNLNTSHSADPVVRKQAMAIAAGRN